MIFVVFFNFFSNNNDSSSYTLRAKRSFSKSLKVDYIFKAKKPRGRAFDRAMHSMSLNPSEIVVIGDQMLTDVFGGKRRGLFTIMVVPVKQTDGFVTKFNRIIERRLLQHFRKKGYITWEEN